MDRILAVTERANAALHALALAAARGGSVASGEAARVLGVSPSYLAKVLQSLAKAGLLESSRGPAGGFSLTKDPRRMTCMEVLVALEGELPERACLFAKPVCGSGECAFSRLCVETAKRFKSTLSRTKISELGACFAE